MERCNPELREKKAGHIFYCGARGDRQAGWDSARGDSHLDMVTVSLKSEIGSSAKREGRKPRGRLGTYKGKFLGKGTGIRGPLEICAPKYKRKKATPLSDFSQLLSAYRCRQKGSRRLRQRSFRRRRNRRRGLRWMTGKVTGSAFRSGTWEALGVRRGGSCPESSRVPCSVDLS